jgi:hypothetical protein
LIVLRDRLTVLGRQLVQAVAPKGGCHPSVADFCWLIIPAAVGLRQAGDTPLLRVGRKRASY